MGVELGRYSNRHGGKNKLRRLVWEVVWAVLFRPTPRWCLNGWRCFLLWAFGARIGKGVRIQGGAKVWQPWRLAIGDNCWIDAGVSLYCVDDIKIGSNAVISEGAFICTATHDISSPIFELQTNPVTIGDSAWVCAKATVLPGVTVGEGAIVAAGSVVAKDVEPWTVVGGNPAKFIKKRELKDESSN